MRGWTRRVPRAELEAQVAALGARQDELEKALASAEKRAARVPKLRDRVERLEQRLADARDRRIEEQRRVKRIERRAADDREALSADAAARVAAEKQARVEEQRRRKRAERDFDGRFRALAGAARHGLHGPAGGEVPATIIDDTRRRMAGASLVEALGAGEDPGTALVSYARAVGDVRGFWLPFSVARSFEEQPGWRDTGLLARAVAAFHARYREHAGNLMSEVPRELAWRLAAPEAAVLVLSGHARMRGLPAAHELAGAPVEDTLDVTETLMAAGETTLAAALLDALPVGTPDVADTAAARVRWLRDALGRAAAAEEVDAGTDAVRFGVVGYWHPQRSAASMNIGDYTQSVAALGHVLRCEDVELTGTSPLDEAGRELAARAREVSPRPSPRVPVQLVEVNRDASGWDAVPEDTWLIAFGWHSHAARLGRFGFPYHPNVRPIFVSFHCNRREMLTDEAIAYLREWGPVGCRDWYTVDLLTQLDVPAFFSGCLTTTIDGYFGPAPEDDETRGRAFVDVAAPAGAVRIAQEYDEVRDAGLAANLRESLAVLDSYRARFSEIVTSRLHCYLPSTSIGIDVDFKPKRRSDIRFEGLADASADDLAEMRGGIRDRLLAPVVTAILERRTPAEVLATWREITEPLVEEHAARRQAPVAWPALPFSLDDEAPAAAQVGDPAPRDAVDICMAFDSSYLAQLHTVTGAIVRHTERHVRLWLLHRDVDAQAAREFESAFPEVAVTWIDCSRVEHGQVTRMIAHISTSTMDRLLIPHLLPSVSRVLYLDLDLLPRADVGELFDIDLDGAPLAARPAGSDLHTSGFRDFVQVVTRIPKASSAGWDFMHAMHQRFAADFRPFNAGVLVMDLDRMREDGFTERFGALAGAYGLHDQDVLNAYAGADYRPLAAHWNHFPNREHVEDPRIVHWLGPAKPWGRAAVPYADEWRAAGAASRPGVPDRG